MWRYYAYTYAVNREKVNFYDNQFYRRKIGRNLSNVSVENYIDTVLIYNIK